MQEVWKCIIKHSCFLFARSDNILSQKISLAKLSRYENNNLSSWSWWNVSNMCFSCLFLYGMLPRPLLSWWSESYLKFFLLQFLCQAIFGPGLENQSGQRQKGVKNKQNKNCLFRPWIVMLCFWPFYWNVL